MRSMDPLFLKGVRDLKGQVLGWGLGMGALIMLTVGLFPSVSELYGDIFEQFPEEWSAFLGEGDFNTLEGFLSVELFSYVHVAVAVFAILAGGSAIVGEESARTIDLLLAQPVSRKRVAIAKLASFTAATVAITVLMSLGMVVIVLFPDELNHPVRILNGFLLHIPFLVMVGFAAALLAQLFGSRMAGGTLLAGYLAASFILEALSGASQLLEDLRPVYLTTYFQGRHAVTTEIEWSYLLTSLAVLVLLALANVVLFVKRDIAVGGVVRLPRLRRRQPAGA